MDFTNACEKGRLDRVVELVNNGVNIHANNEYGFQLACYNGHLEVIKYLMEQEDKPNIHAYNETGFRWACENGRLEVVKYLMEQDDKPNIHAGNEEGFQSACYNGHLEAVRYLVTICDEYEIVMNDGKLISWKVNKDWTKELIGKEREIGVCPICEEERLLYGMKCDERHEMCKECYIEIRKSGESKCPYCRKEMI